MPGDEFPVSPADRRGSALSPTRFLDGRALPNQRLGDKPLHLEPRSGE